MISSRIGITALFARRPRGVSSRLMCVHVLPLSLLADGALRALAAFSCHCGAPRKSMVTLLFARVDFGFCDWLD